ncbi:hypothetical protein [Microbispora bryophytorum]|uniref:hypothetical protein n=1 Tax=Microbispora bryophytorum TaxID=1460882 RepID=UPI0033CCF0E5
MVLAVLASAVPFMLVIMTVSIGTDHLPIVSWRFIGVDARFGLDFLVAGGLPLLALAAAGASSQWWPAGMAGGDGGRHAPRRPGDGQPGGLPRRVLAAIDACRHQRG